MSTLTVVQARMGSRRLPGKVLADLGGRPVLERVLQRVAMADLGRVIVATTARTADQPIADLCGELGVECYRSSEHDVLNRFYRCAIHARVPDDATIVRVTADCPLLCPVLLRAVVDLCEAYECDYTGVEGAPVGFGQECLSFDALEQAWFDADTGYDREHVVTFVQRNDDRFRVAYVEADEALRSRCHWRLTLDEQADLDLLRRLYGLTGGELFGMGSREILAAVESDQALTALAARRV